MADYTIGNKIFTTAALIATIVATNYGGRGLIRTTELIPFKGLWYIIDIIGASLIYSLSCIVIADRIGIFMEIVRL